MQVIRGDLIKYALAGEFDVIIHGCNCFNVMGAGVAKAIKKAFPQAHRADAETVKGSKDKLGSFTKATCSVKGHNLTVINAYTQFDYRGPYPRVDYRAVEDVFCKIGSEYAGFKIGYPKIGCGLAGGDWAVVSQIIDRYLSKCDHTLVDLRNNA